MDPKNFRNSITVRLIIITILILLLLIPSAMITGIVSEREHRKAEAVSELTSKWANAQTIGGPVLTVPYQQTWKDDQGKTQTTVEYLQILPELLEINGALKPEIRYRGIYKAVLYNAILDLKGTFSFAKLDSLNLLPSSLRWNEAFVSVMIPDMRGIKESISLDWNGQSFSFEPGIRRGNDLFNSGISVKLPLTQGNSAKTPTQFSLQLNLNGSEEFNILPLGQKTLVHLKSSWNAPSFDGAFLPEERRIDQQGFTASWKVLDLNRNYPQQWLGATNQTNLMSSQFGVKLFTPVDQYTKTMRSVKYLIMFVGLTFLIFFLVETFNKKRIHPIQYLLIGLSLCIFYLLLLSISEHLSFELAYVIAGIAITGLISVYVKSALGGKGLTLITAGLLVTLYGFMYILLQNQDYALLMGSIGIFAILAIVMFLSRKVDWYQIEVKD